MSSTERRRRLRAHRFEFRTTSPSAHGHVLTPGRYVGAEEVAVERDDDPGLVEPVHGDVGAPEGGDGARALVVVVDRLVGEPLGAGVGGLESLTQVPRGRRRQRLREHDEPVAAVGLQRVELRLEPGERVGPARGLVALHRELEPRRVEEVEHQGLMHAGGAAEGLRVLGVALDLRGTALVGFHDEADRATREVGARGVVLGDAGHVVFGRLGVGPDVLDGAAHAARDARERDGGAHEAEEVTPRRAVLGLFAHAFVVRELARERRLELGRVLQLLEAPPVPLLAHRWHPEQLMGGLIPASFLIFAPSASWSPPAAT